VFGGGDPDFIGTAPNLPYLDFAELIVRQFNQVFLEPGRAVLGLDIGTSSTEGCS
jgi:hypothetical protein